MTFLSWRSALRGGIVAALLSVTAAAPASADLNVLRPTAGDPVTFYGHGGWTGDAKGPTDAQTLDADVPAGSTVRQAYLYGTYDMYSDATGDPSLAARTVTFAGQTVVMTRNAPANPGGFTSARADVTSIVAGAVGSGGGVTSFTASGTPPRPLHGITLVVIYSNPASPQVSIALMEGAARPSGDEAKLTFAGPLDKSVPGFRATMSLGIGWSIQNSMGSHACTQNQYSTVYVDDVLLTGCAGNADDGLNSSEYITFGGVGDTTANPTDPSDPEDFFGEFLFGSHGDDDELYDLAPFVTQGDADLTIRTRNPSNNDNIFLAVIEIAAEASASSNGETPPPLIVAPTPTPQVSSGDGPGSQGVTVAPPSGGSVMLLDGTTAVTSLTVGGVGVYTVVPGTGVITFTPADGYIGTPAAVDYRVENSRGETGDSTYTPTVTQPAAPSPAAKTSSATATAEQTATLVIPSGGRVRLLDGGTEVTALTVAGEGSYDLDAATGIVTFTPVSGFWGPATAIGYRATDSYAQAGSSTYTPTVVRPAAPSPAARTSSGSGPADQSVTLAIPAGGRVRLLDGTTEVTSLTTAGQGTYTLDTATGVVTFAPVLGYSGVATSVAYRITDAYSQAASSTYTPTVEAPAAPSPGARTSSGTGPADQSVTLAIPAGGRVRLLDGTTEVTSLTIAGQGTYALDTTTGVVTFTPVRGYAGSPTPVAFRLTDAYEQIGGATYAPSVGVPPAPDPGAESSTGTGTAVQTETLAIPAGGRVRFLDGLESTETTTLTLTGVGTFALDPQTGAVTFTPVRGFSGTATVPYRAIDAYGQSGDASYTATVAKPAPPPADDVATTGATGAVQGDRVAVPAGGRIMLVDADDRETDVLVVLGIGTYTVDPGTGAMTFAPEPGFVGTPRRVRFRLTDAYGQSVDAWFAPGATVAAAVTSAVPITPAAAAPQPDAAPAACSSRRIMRLHWLVARGTTLRWVELVVNGQPMGRLKPAVRGASVDLRRLAARTVRVQIMARTRDGEMLTSVRTYRPCATVAHPGDLATMQLRRQR